jgi:hypothetical protein
LALMNTFRTSFVKYSFWSKKSIIEKSVPSSGE